MTVRLLFATGLLSCLLGCISAPPGEAPAATTAPPTSTADTVAIIPAAGPSEPFAGFLARFQADSVFQHTRIAPTWELRYWNGSFEEAATIIEQRPAAAWHYDAMRPDEDVEMLYHDASTPDTLGSTLRVDVVQRGMRSGYSVRYRFEWIDGRWLLTMFEDQST